MQNAYDEHMKNLQAYFLPQHVEISANEIETLEESLGTSLPADYRVFLQKFGMSGFTTWAVFPNLKDPTKPDGAVEVFFGINPGERNDLMRVRRGMAGRIPNDVLAIGEIPGGILCLGLSGQGRGKIMVWNQDEDFEEPAMNLRLVSSSLDSFLRSLKPTPRG